MPDIQVKLNVPFCSWYVLINVCFSSVLFYSLPMYMYCTVAGFFSRPCNSVQAKIRIQTQICQQDSPLNRYLTYDDDFYKITSKYSLLEVSCV